MPALGKTYKPYLWVNLVNIGLALQVTQAIITSLIIAEQ